MRICSLALFAPALAGCASVHQNTHDIVDQRGILPLIRPNSVHDVQLSPDGSLLALSSSEGEHAQVVFLRTTDLRVAGSFKSENTATRFGLARYVFTNLEWATEKRIVAQFVLQVGPVGPLYTFGDILAVNIDGSDARMIFGWGADQSWERTKGATGEIGGPMAENAGRIWVPATFWRDGRPLRSEVYDVDVARGEKKMMVEGPGIVRKYFVDDAGAVRVAWSISAEGRAEIYVFEDEWKKLEGFDDARPVGFSGLARALYLVDEDQEGPALVAVGLQTRERTVLARMPGVEPGEIIFDPRLGTPVAVEFELDYPKWHFIEESHPTSEILRLVLEKYPNHHASLKSLSADGTLAVVLAHSDRAPGKYVLANAREKTVRELFSLRTAVDPQAMSPVEAFKVKASDGLELRGYLTVPPGVKSPMPMVVIPHDGPDETRDRWGFDSESQLFASAGFAVLRVNYRGSGGYGAKFRAAGDKRWGDRIQDDIIDATRWAIAEKIADAKKICTYGFGFGGYSALQATIRAPELFQCAVGYSGVYDLSAHALGGDPAQQAEGNDSTELVYADLIRTKKRIEREDDNLAAHSPLYHPEKITVPVLMIHGRADKRAPFRDADKLCLALKKLGKKCETFYRLEQGHRFVGDRDRYDAYSSALDFIEAHTR